MINILIGIFYIALIALVSYLLYYIIKSAIKDAHYELDYCYDKNDGCDDEDTYDNTDLD